MRCGDGPAWVGDGRYLLWSDIPNNRMMHWDEETGATGVFLKPSTFANGNTRERDGRLVTCEHGGWRVTRSEHRSTISVAADRYNGKPLNSPNDVPVRSDHSFWFADLPSGILAFSEGGVARPGLPTTVHRVDGRTRTITVVASDVSGPNRNCFSPPTRRASTRSRAG